MVEFVSPSGETWVGNFSEGSTGGQSAILTELGSSSVVVVAKGAGYIVDVGKKELIRKLVGGIQYICFVSQLHAIIVSNGLWFEAFDAQRPIWRSRRFSWDGIRHVAYSDSAITGEAFDPRSDKWLPFQLELSSGEVVGGTYSGPPT